jgi:hypothetical protein
MEVRPLEQGRASIVQYQGMKCLRPLEHWDRGFESHSRHGRLFILFVLGSGLATG